MYYDTTGVAMVSLFWQSSSQTQQVIPSSSYYYKQSEVPITGDAFMIDAQYTPMKPLSLTQGDSTTFSATSLTLTWAAPSDDGCLPILDYKIQSYDGVTWNDETLGIVGTTGTVSGLTAGVSS
jgi:hypothetical protein